MIENVVSTERYRPEGEDALVRLRHTYKVYRVGDMGVVALAGVDLDVMRGEFLAVVGPSGAGKSTILNLVGGLDRASAGVVEVEGRDLGLLEDEALTEYRAERIGFVWQGTARNLVPYLSVRENIRLPATVRRTQVARKHDVDGLLDLVGLHGPREAHAGHALRRRAAARGDRGGAVEHAVDPPRRRADGRAGLRVRGPGPRRVPRGEPRVPRDDHHGHARPRRRPASGSPHPGARRAGPARRACRSIPSPTTVACVCPTRRSPRWAASTSKPRSPRTRCACDDGARPVMPEPALVEGIDVVRRYPGTQGVIAVRGASVAVRSEGLRGADGTERLGEDDVPRRPRGSRPTGRGRGAVEGPVDLLDVRRGAPRPPAARGRRRLPELRIAAGPVGRRERRAAVAGERRGSRGGAGARGGMAAPARAGDADAQPDVRAVGRAAAARGGRPRADPRAGDRGGRRADRRGRHRERRRDPRGALGRDPPGRRGVGRHPQPGGAALREPRGAVPRRCWSSRKERPRRSRATSRWTSRGSRP